MHQPCDIHTHSISHQCRREGAYPISPPCDLPHAAVPYGIYFSGGKSRSSGGMTSHGDE